MLIIIAGNIIDVVNILTRLGIRMVKSELEPCRYLKSTWSRNGAKKTGGLKKKMLMQSHTNTHTHTHTHKSCVFVSLRLAGLSIDFDEECLYWVSSGNSTINRCKLDGSELEVLEAAKGTLTKATAL